MIMSSSPPEMRPARFGHQHRGERARAVAGHRKMHRPDAGLHRFPDRPIAGITAVVSRQVVLGITEMGGKLCFQRPLQNSFH